MLDMKYKDSKTMLNEIYKLCDKNKNFLLSA